jgi:hypothetical protein
MKLDIENVFIYLKKWNYFVSLNSNSKQISVKIGIFGVNFYFKEFNLSYEVEDKTDTLSYPFKKNISTLNLSSLEIAELIEKILWEIGVILYGNINTLISEKIFI